MGLCADTWYVQSVSFSIIYFTSVLLKSGVIFFGVTLISDGVLSWVSWLTLFMENIDVELAALGHERDSPESKAEKSNQKGMNLWLPSSGSSPGGAIE